MGLAPILVERMFESIVELAHEGRTIVLVEQLAELVMEIADYVIVISKGRVAEIGQPADVRDALEDLYLGGEARVTGDRVTDDDRLWRTPAGTLAHRGSCPVVVTRQDVQPVGSAEELERCAICSSPALATVAA
jgi:ABC-type multidrug transport system ATPase subunit